MVSEPRKGETNQIPPSPPRQINLTWLRHHGNTTVPPIGYKFLDVARFESPLPADHFNIFE